MRVLVCVCVHSYEKGTSLPAHIPDVQAYLPVYTYIACKRGGDLTATWSPTAAAACIGSGWLSYFPHAVLTALNMPKVRTNQNARKF